MACDEGECLLCYLSLKSGDEKVQGLISRYQLQYDFFTYKNPDAGFLLSLNLKEEVAEVAIIKPERFRLPAGITATTPMKDLVARFGTSSGLWDDIYVFNYTEAVEIWVNYESSPDRSIPGSVRLLLKKDYRIDTACFTKGFGISVVRRMEQTPEQQFGASLNQVILSSLDGFNGADTQEFGKYGKGWVDQDRFALLIAKPATQEEAYASVESFDDYLDGIKTSCCFFLRELSVVDYLTEETPSFTIRTVAAISDGVDERIRKVKIMVRFWENDDHTFETYMLVKLTE